MKQVIFLAFLLFIVQNNIAQDNNTFNNLTKKLEQTQNRDTIFKLLKQQEIIAKTINNKIFLAQVYNGLGQNSIYDGKQMETYSRKASNLYRSLKDTANLARTQYKIANSKIAQSDYYGALKEADSAYYWVNLLQDNVLKVKLHALKADANSHLGNYVEAISELNIAKDILLKTDNSDQKLIRIYGSESLIHYSNKKYREAIATLKKIIEFYENKNDNKRIVIWSNNLASTYFECQCISVYEQEKLLLKSIDYSEKSNFIYGKGFAYRLLAEVYLKNNKLKKTKMYLDKVDMLIPKINKPDFKGLVYQTHGSYWDAIHDDKKTVFYYKKAYDVFKQIGSLTHQKKLTMQLATLNNNLGFNKKAYNFLKSYVKVNDSLFNKKKIEEFKELELTAKFKRTRYTDSIQVAQEKQLLNLNHELEITKQKQDKNILYTFLSLAGLITLFVYVAFRRKKKQKEILDIKNKLIEKTLLEKDLLLKEVHHRVKNNFQIVSSLLELQSKGIKDEKALELVEEGKSRVKSMALIHQKLYQNDDLLIAFDEYVQSLVKDISSMYGKDKNPKINVNIPEYKFDIDTAIPLGLIINELITNAYKYGFSNNDQVLDIQISKGVNNNYVLNIKDNGIGLPEDFDFSKAKSLGLRLVRRLSKQLQGSTTYSYDKGSLFSVMFKDSNARSAID